MSKTPESKVKQQVKKLLDEHGAWHNWPVPGGYGIPMLDAVGCHRGDFFAVETKAPGQHLTPRQEFTKAQMELAGGVVFVIGEGLTASIENDPDTWHYSGMAELEAWLKRPLATGEAYACGYGDGLARYPSREDEWRKLK